MRKHQRIFGGQGKKNRRETIDTLREREREERGERSPGLHPAQRPALGRRSGPLSKIMTQIGRREGEKGAMPSHAVGTLDAREENKNKGIAAMYLLL